MVASVRHDESVTVREVDGEILVLDLRSNQVHQFNPTASFIWKRCAEGQTSQAIAAALAGEFEVDEETARRDVEETLGRFLSLNLLVEFG